MATEQDLRYPIGRFQAPEEETSEARIDQMLAIRQFPVLLRYAVTGLLVAQLDTPYREGGWTVRQVVHHLADSHANAFVRFKLALTEDWPTIKPYNEAAWAELPDSRLPIDGSLSLIEALHERWVALLEAMNSSDFERGYFHPEMGRQTLARVLALYAWHGKHHTAHITGLKQRQGW